MKKLTLFLLLVTTGTTVYSASSVENSLAYCDLVKAVAFATQSFRQRGYDLQETVENLVSKEEKDVAVIEGNLLVLLIAPEAYKTPLYQTPALQKEAITDFEDKYYAMCLRSINNKYLKK